MNRPGYLPPHLTEQQLEAILARGSPLLIIAGPGSGKTEVVTWRVAHLVASGQAESAHCLVTTFTNQEIARYEGRHDDPIYIAYFILPADIISEDIHGPYGYADDIWLCAWVADIVRRELDNDDILTENWDGEVPLMPQSIRRRVCQRSRRRISTNWTMGPTPRLTAHMIRSSI